MELRTKPILWISVFFIFLLVSVTYGEEWIFDNQNHTGYNITNVGNIYSDYYCNGTTCYTITQLLGTGDIESVNTPGQYLYGGATSGDVNLYINETELNSTIDSRDNDTTYSAGSNITITANVIAWSSTWAESVFVKIANLVGLVGNWTADKPNYYNKSQVYNTSEVFTKTETNVQITNANDSMKSYVDSQDQSYNTSMTSYVDGTFITQASESNLNVNSSDYWDNYNTPSDINNLLTIPCGNISGATSNLCTIIDTDSFWTIDNIYLNNVSGTLTFNESRLNDTIDSRAVTTESDPVWISNKPYYFNKSTSISVFVNRSDWTTIDDFPAACGAGDFVTQVGDTLTCSTPAYIGNCSASGSCSLIVYVGDEDKVKIKYQNITNLPTCAGNEVLTYDGSTLSCTSKTSDTDTHVAGDGIYLYNDSTTMYLNETKLNSTIDTKVTASNDSMKSYVDGTFITQANEGNLNVNSSDYWDNLNSPSDINAGDITDDGTYYDTSSNINASGYNVTADYFLGDGSELTGILHGNLILYFLNKTSSDVAGNKTLSSIPNETEVTLSDSSLPDGSYLMGVWVTDAGVPNINLILPGVFYVDVEGKRTSGTKSVQFYYEVYKTNSTGGAETLVATSQYSDYLTGTRQQFNIFTSIPETRMNLTDRIRIKGYSYVTGGGSAPDVEAYIQGASLTRLEIPVGAISVEKFVPYVNAISDINLGSHNITASSFLGNINASYVQNENWIEDSQEGNLNVNSSNYWDTYDQPTDIQNLLTIPCGNVSGAASNLCTIVDTDTTYNFQCSAGDFVKNLSNDGGYVCDTPAGGGDITAVQGDNIYIYNGSNSGDVNLAFNETKLNATIDARDTDTTYSAGTGLDLTATTFSLLWTYLSNFTDDLGDRGYTSLSNFTNDIDLINSTYGNATYIKQTEEANLNVNSSNYWDNYNIPSDVQNLLTIPCGNISGATSNLCTIVDTDTDTHVKGDGNYLYNDSTTMYLNETVLNATIDARDTNTNCSVDGSCPNIIYESEETGLNVNSSAYWDNLNSPSDINAGDITDDGTYIPTADLPLANKTLPYCGNITGATSNLCTITDSDTDTHVKGDGIYLTNDSDTMYFNETKMNDTIDTRAVTTEVDPAWSANFTNMQVDCPTGNYTYGVFDNGTLKCRDDESGTAGAAGWNITGSNYLINVSNILNLNETKLNATIDDKVTTANTSMKSYVDAQDVIYNDSMKTYTDATFITQANEGNLNVNHSNSTDYWDSYNVPSDIQDLLTIPCGNVSGATSNLCTIVDTTIGNCSASNSCSNIIYSGNTSWITDNQITYTNSSFDLSQIPNTGNVAFGAHNISVSSSTAESLCYQETANETSACGGLATGTYWDTGTYSVGSMTEVIDGNWSSYAQGSDSGTYILINYTKPTLAQHPITWQIRIGAAGDPIVNRTIPQDCWDSYSDKVSLKLMSYGPTTSSAEALCWNGTSSSFISVYDAGGVSGGRPMYEEAVYWNLSASSTTVFLADITNSMITGVDFNATGYYYGDGSQLTGISTSDTWWGLNEGYIYNNSNSLDFNETKLNATIDARDSDTTYTNSSFDLSKIPITGNLNMSDGTTNYNMTNVDCIHFASGGSICTGS